LSTLHTPTPMYVCMNESLVHDEDEVDDDIEEGLAEYHEQDECREEYAAREVEAQLRPAQLRAQHEGIPNSQRQTKNG
jgi:hypothetical protein